jgi:cytidylate kinase
LLLAESYSGNPATEGSVVKGRMVSIENDFAIIDVRARDDRDSPSTTAPLLAAKDAVMPDTPEMYMAVEARRD